MDKSGMEHRRNIEAIDWDAAELKIKLAWDIAAIESQDTGQLLMKAAWDNTAL